MARIVVWKDLPSEAQELVLARLPFHVLCRFRKVCKGWNQVITQPRFASLRRQVPRQASYVLITPKLVQFDPFEDSVVNPGSGRDWQLLEMEEGHFYTLSDSFVNVLPRRDLFKDQFCIMFEPLGWSRFTMAADGGLIYAVYGSSRTGVQRHIVCDPVRKSYREIMEPDSLFSYDNMVVMVVDRSASDKYRIITIEAYASDRPGKEELHLYDSASETPEWRKLCQVPGEKNLQACSCIFLGEAFYTLFCDLAMAPWCLQLYSCDLDTREWNCVDVELPQPSHTQDRSQLVVSLGCLFFVEFTGLPTERGSLWERMLDRTGKFKRKHVIKLSIWEVNLLGEKGVKKVAEMPKFAKYSRKMLDRPQGVMGEAVVAIGCGNSIVISSLVGRCVGWDLVRKCWHELPENIVRMHDFSSGHNRQGIFSSAADF